MDGAELETVSAQLSKELEQMTLPVLEKIQTAASEGESFDNREIKVSHAYYWSKYRSEVIGYKFSSILNSAINEICPVDK